MWVNCFKCLRGICKSGNAGCDTVMGKNCGFCYSDEQWTTSMQRYLAKLVSWSSLDAETEKLGEDIQVHWRRQWHPAPVLLPGKSHGREEPSRLQSMGSVGHDWATERLHFHALEKEMAAHFSVLAWRIPGTGELGGLLSMGLHRVGHDWSDLAAVAVHVQFS